MLVRTYAGRLNIKTCIRGFCVFHFKFSVFAVESNWPTYNCKHIMLLCIHELQKKCLYLLSTVKQTYKWFHKMILLLELFNQTLILKLTPCKETLCCSNDTQDST